MQPVLTEDASVIGIGSAERFYYKIRFSYTIMQKIWAALFWLVALIWLNTLFLNKRVAIIIFTTI